MSSSDFQAQSLWAKLKSILSPPDTNLRESLEDVLEDEVGNDESLTGEELHMLRNLLGFKDVRVEDVMVPRADRIWAACLRSPAIRDCRFTSSHWIIRSAWCTLKILWLCWRGKPQKCL